MKYILTSALLVSSVFASVVPRDNKKVDYSGFKLLRLENTAGLEAKIEELSAHVLRATITPTASKQPWWKFVARIQPPSTKFACATMMSNEYSGNGLQGRRRSSGVAEGRKPSFWRLSNDGSF